MWRAGRRSAPPWSGNPRRSSLCTDCWTSCSRTWTTKTKSPKSFNIAKSPFKQRLKKPSNLTNRTTQDCAPLILLVHQRRLPDPANEKKKKRRISDQRNRINFAQKEYPPVEIERKGGGFFLLFRTRCHRGWWPWGAFACATPWARIWRRRTDRAEHEEGEEEEEKARSKEMIFALLFALG